MLSAFFDVDLSLECQTLEPHLVQPSLFDRTFVQSNAHTIIMYKHNYNIQTHYFISMLTHIFITMLLVMQKR